MLRRALAILLASTFFFGVVANAWAEDERPIVVGSKNFTENRLLGEIMAQLIESQGKRVERRLNLGGTTVVFSALESGAVDLYPEYTGTAWTLHLKFEETVRDPLRAYLTARRELLARHELRFLSPFGFSNSYAIAMSGETARRLGIARVSDLKAHAKSLRAGVSHEFLNRQDGFVGLAAAYELGGLDVRGMEHGLAYDAIHAGQIDLFDSLTTDGKLLRFDVTVLEDDRRFFPPYDAAPLVRASTLERHPELAPLLERLAFRIDDATMRQLNFRVEEQGGSYASVARGFLVESGLLEGDVATAPAVRGDASGIAAFFRERASTTLSLALEHMLLTVLSVVLAIAVAVPGGIALARRPRWAPFFLSAAGVVQTIPSLALLAFVIPLPGFGLGPRSAVFALFLYALLPILRNTFTGIREVDPLLVDAARGLGLRERQILFRVQLPMAARTLMAGVRTATVISVGVATLAAFIGAGGLGEPILTGLQLNDMRLVFAGAVPAAVLALLSDAALSRVERAVTPSSIR